MRLFLAACVGVAVLVSAGVAGPTGGTPENPAGTVWIAVAGPSVVEVRKLFWPGEREQIRMLAAYAVLHLLLKTLTR